MVALMSLFVAQALTQEVTFKGAGGFELQGTYVKPASQKPVAALLLLPGSGPTDRDENVPQAGLKTDVLKQIAERLAAEGVATLRFDKRAVIHYHDKWPKDMAEVNTFFGWDKFVGDAKAAYDFLRSQPGVDPAKVGLLGHSEGALICLQIGNDLEGTKEQPATLILISGNARTLDVVLLEQLRSKLPLQYPAEKAKALVDYAEKAIEQVKKDGTIPEGLPSELMPLFNPSSMSILRSYFTTDPLVFARHYTGDVLVINGELDNQVSLEKDARLLLKTLEERKSGMEKLVPVPGVGHLLKKTPSFEANVMTGPVVPEVLDAIAAWMKERG